MADAILPGEKVAPVLLNPKVNQQQASLGNGLHVSNAQAFSSLAGSLNKSDKAIDVQGRNERAKLPCVNAVVLARVTRINSRQANVTILAVEDVPCTAFADEPSFGGVIRVQDVRATEKDKVVVAESFSVGDIIRAVVISIGDERSYYLSTAQNELGVVMAKGADTGAPMYPVSWKEVVDSVTGKRELRKVAKPDI